MDTSSLLESRPLSCRISETCMTSMYGPLVMVHWTYPCFGKRTKPLLLLVIRRREALLWMRPWPRPFKMVTCERDRSSSQVHRHLDLTITVYPWSALTMVTSSSQLLIPAQNVAH